MDLLFLDTETFLHKKEGYRLGKDGVSIVEYVRDERFKLHGLSFAFEGQVSTWMPGDHVGSAMSLFDWSKIALVGHNLKFDAFILAERYGIRPAQYIDTMCIARAVLGKTVPSHSLGALAKHFELGEKGEMETDGLRELTAAEEQALASYCDNDVKLTMKLYEKLAPEFPASQYPYMDWTIRTFVTPKLVLDVPILEKCAEDERAEKEKKFQTLGIEKDVFSSNQKFAALLTERGYVCPVKQSGRKKNEDGSAASIPALALGDPAFLDLLESSDPVLKSLCEARVAAKSTLLETRSTKLANIGRTGPWPFDVEFSGADQTHRYSGGSGSGGNPQNFTACRDKKEHKAGHQCPGALRSAVTAGGGFRLVIGDLSQIELRLNGWLCGDQWIIQAMEQGRSVYCEFASTFFGRAITKNDELEYKLGKTAELSLGYNSGWQTFQKKVRADTGQTITDKVAKDVVNIYRKRHVRIVETWHFLDKIIPRMTEHGKGWVGSMPVKYGHEYIELPSGLKMRYPNLRQVPGKRGPQWAYDIYRKNRLETTYLYGGKLLENICQALAGEICKEATAPFFDVATGVVHDEIHLVVKAPLAPLMAQKLKRVMSQSPSWMPRLKLDAEVGYSTNWLEAK